MISLCPKQNILSALHGINVICGLMISLINRLADWSPNFHKTARTLLKICVSPRRSSKIEKKQQ